MTRILVTRMDNAGDVLLAGPAVRAAAAHGSVSLLCGPSGEPAARLLPDVAEILVWDAPWTGFSPPPVDSRSVSSLVQLLATRGFDAAAVLTSFHQSPLPMALLLRLAGVPRIGAVSVDYPGSLIDQRVRYRDELHEVEQALEVTAALGMGYPDDDRLSVAIPSGHDPDLRSGYVVVHPSASVPARGLPPALVEESVRLLGEAGRTVVVTGTAVDEGSPGLPLPGVVDLRGATSFADLAAVIRAADALVVGNSGPAHLASATGTPVVSVFAPVVPAHRWRPWRVPTILLGDQRIECAGCRSRRCPLSVQECVAGITAIDVVEAVDRLAGTGARRTA